MRTQAVTTGRWVRLLLLLCTLVGLTAMHTLGHAAHASGGDRAGHAVAGHAAPHAVPAGMTDGCRGGGCGHARLLPLGDAHSRVLPLGDPGGDRSGWSICLAVLGAFAVTLLIAMVLRAGSRASGPAARGALRPAPGPRAPPTRPYGLRLATASVLRR